MPGQLLEGAASANARDARPLTFPATALCAVRYVPYSSSRPSADLNAPCLSLRTSSWSNNSAGKNLASTDLNVTVDNKPKEHTTDVSNVLHIVLRRNVVVI
ncbi:hypothetical protein CH63R_10037 [Colletotrichum higginsianum IMI 349063]|uniref:Uncharacterized protein n=1 Tax=Colletotrichum higginsianum (strain IMI 349063) TaxID=759273 RepID=A0A1B7Y1Q3_COLHI|nr:uncharacterized protein CH63R_10037 [Colletotrichum higginsianum IMI 349063]OBR05917.1 hypothetical protein CH63R_10037 [Colletotrichum higginsianum IMI 349063]